MNSPEPLLDVAGGDPAVSRQLKEALRLLATNSPDPALREQIGAVLDGKLAVRDFVRAEAFNQTLDRVMPAALADYEAMPEEQRQRLAEQGEAELERYRQAPAQPTPPTTSPDPAPDGQRPSEQPQQPSATPEKTSTDRLIPGTRKPNRDLIVTPDEPDDDDLYFRDRRQRGWLE